MAPSKALNSLRRCNQRATPPGRASSAKPNANNINIALTAISVGGQQFVPSHWDACSGYTMTVPALSAWATTVTTAMPVVKTKAIAKTSAIFFMIVSPSPRHNPLCQNRQGTL
jgi:hypothetical protein